MEFIAIVMGLLILGGIGYVMTGSDNKVEQEVGVALEDISEEMLQKEGAIDIKMPNQQEVKK